MQQSTSCDVDRCGGVENLQPPSRLGLRGISGDRDAAGRARRRRKPPGGGGRIWRNTKPQIHRARALKLLMHGSSARMFSESVPVPWNKRVLWICTGPGESRTGDRRGGGSVFRFCTSELQVILNIQTKESWIRRFRALVLLVLFTSNKNAQTCFLEPFPLSKDSGED